MCGFYLCTGICLTTLRARMPADQAKASPPHTSSVRGLLRTKRGSRLNVCYVWLLPVHRYLLDEAAGTDARGPNESQPASHAFGPWTLEDQVRVQT